MGNNLPLDSLFLKLVHWPKVRQSSFHLYFVLKVRESVRQNVQDKSSPLTRGSQDAVVLRAPNAPRLQRLRVYFGTLPSCCMRGNLYMVP